MSGLRVAWKKFSRDRLAFTGFLIILALVLTALLAGVLSPYPEDTHKIHPASRLKAPSMKHLLGTDHMGRDILSRLLFGARVTLIIAIIAVATSLLIGVPLGLIAGYLENWVSELIMRIADIFLSIPQVILALFMAKTLGPSIPNVILALSVTYWPWFTRIVFAETKTLKKSVFIEATEALGAERLRHHGAPSSSECLFLHHRPQLDRYGLYHLDRRRPRFFGRRGSASDPGVGCHHCRVEAVPS